MFYFMTFFGISPLAPFFFDEQINSYINSIRNLSLVKFFRWVTFFGEVEVIIVFGLISLIILWYSKKKWTAAILWFIIVGGECITYFAKIFFNRPRPDNAVYMIESNSFPSGHAMISMVFYGFVAYLLFRNTKNRLYKYLIFIGSIILILLIGFSRLYLGVHYLSDVVVGYILGLFWLLIGIVLAEWKLFDRKSSNKNISSENIAP